MEARKVIAELTDYEMSLRYSGEIVPKCLKEAVNLIGILTDQPQVVAKKEGRRI